MNVFGPPRSGDSSVPVEDRWARNRLDRNPLFGKAREANPRDDGQRRRRGGGTVRGENDTSQREESALKRTKVYSDRSRCGFTSTPIQPTAAKVIVKIGSAADLAKGSIVVESRHLFPHRAANGTGCALHGDFEIRRIRWCSLYHGGIEETGRGWNRYPITSWLARSVCQTTSLSVPVANHPNSDLRRVMVLHIPPHLMDIFTDHSVMLHHLLLHRSRGRLSFCHSILTGIRRGDSIIDSNPGSLRHKHPPPREPVASWRSTDSYYLVRFFPISSSGPKSPLIKSLSAKKVRSSPWAFHKPTNTCRGQSMRYIPL